MSDDLKFSERIVMGALGPAGDILVNELRKAFDEIQELRSRVRALEQNTTPARPAEHKQYAANYSCGCKATGSEPLPKYCPNHPHAFDRNKPREWWMNEERGTCYRFECCDHGEWTASGYIHVREVL